MQEFWHFKSLYRDQRSRYVQWCTLGFSSGGGGGSVLHHVGGEVWEREVPSLHGVQKL